MLWIPSKSHDSTDEQEGLHGRQLEFILQASCFLRSMSHCWVHGRLMCFFLELHAVRNDMTAFPAAAAGMAAEN